MGQQYDRRPVGEVGEHFARSERRGERGLPSPLRVAALLGQYARAQRRRDA